MPQLSNTPPQRRRPRRAKIAGLALVLTASGAVAVTAGVASADTYSGIISVECNAQLFDDVNLEGEHSDVRSGTFSSPLVINVSDNNSVVPIENAYDLDVGNAGRNASSMDVTCNVTNRSETNVTIYGYIDHLAPSLSNGAGPPGPSCGKGTDYSENELFGGNNDIGFTLFESNFVEDFPACNDNLSRISLKIGIK